MTRGDEERIRQIQADLEAAARKWHLEFLKRMATDGTITLQVGVSFTPIEQTQQQH